MSKGVRDVRRSIKQRRKNRRLRSNKASHISENIKVNDIDDHARYGELKNYIPGHLNQGNKLFSIKSYVKILISVSLICAAYILFQTDVFSNPTVSQWFEEQMTEEFPFARMNEWYQQTFGHPLAINPVSINEPRQTDDHVLPVSGNVSETFQVNGRGIMIAPQGETQVTAWQDGIVIFSGNDRRTGKTVIVQHADRSQTTYGYLNDVNVHLYQYINHGQHIGNFTPSEDRDSVYFSLEKENEYIDPIQVIQVDDR